MTNTNRTFVTVTLVDQNVNVPANLSVVARFNDVVLVGEDTQKMLMNLVMEEDVKGALKQYNEARQQIVDRKILERTGSSVKLEPVTISDLDVQIK